MPPKDLSHDYVLSQMSLAAYDDQPRPPEGWNVIDSVNTNDKTGFVAFAFQNPSTNEVVIAFRGTDNAKDIDADYAMAPLPGTAWHEQFKQALDFTDKVMHEHPEAVGKTFLTGHSLGGGLAEVCTQMYGLPGRTFDPAGAKNITQSDQFRAYAMGHSTTPAGGVGAHNDFKGYVVGGSMVSSLTLSHVGQTEPISGIAGRSVIDVITEHTSVWKLGKGQLNRHSMGRINGMFEKAVREGKPVPRYFAANEVEAQRQEALVDSMPQNMRENVVRLVAAGADTKLQAAGCSAEQCDNILIAFAGRMAKKGFNDQVFFGVDPKSQIGVVGDMAGKTSDVSLALADIKEQSPEKTLELTQQQSVQVERETLTRSRSV